MSKKRKRQRKILHAFVTNWGLEVGFIFSYPLRNIQSLQVFHNLREILSKLNLQRRLPQNETEQKAIKREK